MTGPERRASPELSIVVPVHNRAAFLGRTLRSCLEQSFADFELIVVDDASTDESVDVALGFDDARIRLIRHEVNRGVSGARNTGLLAARGEWVIFLDSDDELLPHALARVARLGAEVGGDVAGLRFMVQDDAGRRSPEPALPDAVWDYAQYVRWIDVVFQGRQESLVCVRRETREQVRFPEGRGPLELLYLLDFARLYAVRNSAEVVRLYHNDAPDQLTRALTRASLRVAAEQAVGMQALLERHGEALRRWAPAFHAQLVAGIATMHFLAGDRRAGLAWLARGARERPLAPRVWGILLLGMVGPDLLARARELRTRWLRRRVLA